MNQTQPHLNNAPSTSSQPSLITRPQDNPDASQSSGHRAPVKDSAVKDTPLMKQYWEIKSLHNDKILFFRMGDFYEMFFDDAVKAAPLLGIALTMRNKKAQNETPMCGIPHHSVAGPINKLLRLGHKVALCDQIEDPKLAKGIVKRAVTRVLTPGMVLDPESLEASEQNLIACAAESCLAAADPSTGEAFFYEDLSPEELNRLVAMLNIVEWAPSEASKLEGSSDHKNLADQKARLPMAAEFLESYLASLNPDPLGQGRQSLELIWKKRSAHRFLKLSSQCLKQLEIFLNYQGEERGTLFHAIDRTQTAPAKRLLKEWLKFPLLDVTELQERQKDLVRLKDLGLFELRRLQKRLSPIGDLERRFAKASGPGANARDLQALAMSIVSAHGFLVDLQDLSVISSAHGFESMLKAAEKALNYLVDDPPLNIKQGYLIRQGLLDELDELITLTQESSRLLEELEQRERAATQITSLKVRYNQVFGYYIEITNTHKDKIPSHYQRKQTLANAERFCTDELLELEKKILTAAEKRGQLEYQIFSDLKSELCQVGFEVLRLARECAYWDILIGFNELAVERNWTLPLLISKAEVDLELSRHPVLEQLTSDFVSNDVKLLEGQCLCLTGPNMAGKSTLMRQVALAVILHQIGCFVPAQKARMGLFDQILTRIGLSDALSEGLSTFMVEMTDAAKILSGLSQRSLLVIDEIGRGTSTFDGMSLAQAILEYLLKQKKGLTFFATHYHELTALENQFDHLINGHLAISDEKSDSQGSKRMRFLYQLKRGPAGKSYGVEVAKLAGLPKEVCARAEQILENLEKEPTAKSPIAKPSGQLTLFADSQPQLGFAEESSSQTQGFHSKDFREPTAEEPTSGEPTLEEFTSRNNPLRDQIISEVQAWDYLGKPPLESLLKLQEWKTRLQQLDSRPEMTLK